ncbi:MAG TPA: hypothetical protein ENL46_02655, partial [Candidatus Aminicenantes bacterium]|nr:hypothetical protein [Candidatus Aminicenantes bacterium]
MTGTKNKDSMDLSLLVPEKVNGWKAGEEDRIYDKETIFDYIDGAGEVYNAYQFKKLRARNFSRPGSPDILVDLFDMGSSRNAYGVFTHDLEGERVGIGQDSTYKGGLLCFWKDRFFVSLYAERETEESREAVMELGQEISSRIPNKGSVPEVVSLLPEEELDKSRVRYFFNPLILNYHFHVSDENPLSLNPETEAALGIYGEGESVYRLLLVLYPDEEKARKAYQDFMNAYMPEAPGSPEVEIEDGTWTVAEVKGKMLVIVFGAPGKV